MQLTSIDSNLILAPEANFSRTKLTRLQNISALTQSALEQDTWWKTSPLLPIIGLPALTTITAPYTWPTNYRVADLLGLTSLIIKRFLDAGGRFCQACLTLNPPLIPQPYLLLEHSPNYFCITGTTDATSAISLGYPKLIANGSVIDLEEIEASSDSEEYEVIVDRISCSAENVEERYQQAIKALEKLPLKYPSLQPWPPTGQKIAIGTNTRCWGCLRNLTDPNKMLHLLAKSFWNLPDTRDTAILAQLYNPIGQIQHDLSPAWDILELNKINAATPVAKLGHDIQHLLMISTCLAPTTAASLAIISPLTYQLSHDQLLRAITAIRTLRPAPHRTIITTPDEQRLLAVQSALGSSEQKYPPPFGSEIPLGTISYQVLPEQSLSELSNLEHRIAALLPEHYKTTIILPTAASTSPYAMVATISGCFTPLRQLYAKTAEARIKGYTAKDFSILSGKLRCSVCFGKGEQCPACHGSRYTTQVDQIRFNGLSLSKALTLPLSTVNKALQHITPLSQPLRTLQNFSLGHLHLGAALTTLGCAELYALQLLAAVNKATKQTCLIIVRPETMISQQQLEALNQHLQNLCGKGACAIILS